jgi:hypothetical protein
MALDPCSGVIGSDLAGDEIIKTYKAESSPVSFNRMMLAPHSWTAIMLTEAGLISMRWKRSRWTPK